MCKKEISFIFALILFITSISQVKAYDPDIDAGSRMKYDRDESREETYSHKVRREKKDEVFEQWRIGIDSILFGKINTLVKVSKVVNKLSWVAWPAPVSALSRVDFPALV
jgi:hypothetical protein